MVPCRIFIIASTGLYRIDQLEKGQDDLEEDVDGIGNITIDAGRDLVWLRWGMMVVVPAVLGHFGFAIYQLAFSRQSRTE